MAEIIVALDGIQIDRALNLAYTLKDLVWGFKVNDLLFREGSSVVSRLRHYGRVMCDGKHHDIPNTISNCVKALDEAGADLLTIHAAGGIEMMTAAVREAKHTKVIAVTTLTSIDAKPEDINKWVDDAAVSAKEAGVHGIVCPIPCLETIKKYDLIKVCPGIRLPDESIDDQKQVGSPMAAIDANYIVVGRPIVQADSPKEAALKYRKALRLD